MDKKNALIIGLALAATSATAVVARTGMLAQRPAPSVCAPDRASETGDRATLLSDKRLAISANGLVVASTGRVLDPESCVGAGGMLRHLSVLPGTGAAFVIDQAGQDVLSMVTAETTTSVASGLDITHPTWSPRGQLAWSENLEVLKVMSSDGAQVSGVVLPKGTVSAFSPLFLDERRVMAVVQDLVPGAQPEDESLNNLWVFDLESGRWSQKTSFEAAGDDWIGIRTPVLAPDDSILFVRISGNASETEEPRFELWRYAEGNSSKVRSLPGEMYLAGLEDGRLYWNAPSRTCGDWGLFVEEPDALKQVGCGAVMTDPVAVADPDQLVEAEGDDEDVEVSQDDELTDLMIVVGDFGDRSAAAEAATRIGGPARVIAHKQAPTALRPGAWGLLVDIPAGVAADDHLEEVRGRLSVCDCGAWLVPSI